MVRRANARDIPSIVCIWKENIETSNTFVDIAFAFRRNRKYWFVSIDEGNNKITGFVAGTMKSSERGHISGIAVVPDRRRKGIGGKLIETAEDAFMRDGFKKITLEVRKSNVGAQNFYEKQGYTPTYVTGGYYPDGEDAINYEKNHSTQVIVM
jgi:ribosomal-protein-alanine N-acetyltransferase